MTTACDVRSGQVCPATEAAFGIALNWPRLSTKRVRLPPVVLFRYNFQYFNVLIPVSAVKRGRIPEEWRNWQTRRIQNAVTERP